MTTDKYIKGKEISEMEISVYKNILDHIPTSKTTIKQLMSNIKNSHGYNTPNGYINISTIRDIYNKYGHKSPEYKRIKSLIPCVTPSGLFKYANNESLISPTNLLVLDIDDLYNKDINQLKRDIFKLPYVYSVCESLSGNGLWVIIPISPDKDRVKIFNHINREFKLKYITIDQLKDIARLRIISIDPYALVKDDNEDILIYDKELDLPADLFSNRDKFDYKNIIRSTLSGNRNSNDPLYDDDLCYYAAKYSIECCNYTCSDPSNNMNNWLGHLCSLSTIGYRGYDLALTLSRQSDGFKSESEVYKAFNNMSKKANGESRKGFLRYFGVCKRELGKSWINQLKDIYKF